MRTWQHELGIIYVPGPNDSLRGLVELANRGEYFAFDTEGTGLQQYAADFRVKLVQMGTADTAYVLNPLFPRHRAMIKKLMETGPEMWAHNMIFDLISLEVGLGLNFELMARRTKDTGIDTRLLDPRPPQHGGTGHKLEQLTVHYLKTGSKKSTRTLLNEAWGRGAKVKIADVFREVPVDLPEYEIYAGQDVFLTARLAAKTHPMVMARPELRRLHSVEHPLAIRLSQMERTGMIFDHEWGNKAEEHFNKLRDAAEKKLVEKWKVTPSAKFAHTSARSLKGIFGELGAKFEKQTKPSKTYPEGQVSLDSEVLKAFSREPGEIGEMASDVLIAKRSEHYANYVRTMRDLTGTDGRVHPKLHALAAATARMAVSSPAAQQFPRDDIYVRGCLLADEGDRIFTSDYQAVEFRVAAGVSRDPVMTSRIISGEDLHAVTATALFGPGFNKGQRQASKPISFGRLYLGGAKGIRQAMIQADTTGYVPSLKDIQRAIKAFDKDYNVFARWGKREIKQVGAAHGHLTTVTGRPLIVDRDYAAVNYQIQSAARDVLAAGITNIHKAGLGGMLRLVVHDEVIMSVNPREAKEIQREVERCMNTTLLGVPITTESELKGIRWSK